MRVTCWLQLTIKYLKVYAFIVLRLIKMQKQLSVYVTVAQYEWLQLQPRSFNLSKEVRLLFDSWMGIKYEKVVANGNTTE